MTIVHLPFFYVFQVHCCDSVFNSYNIHQVFVPAGCTGELQPLDLSVNEDFKLLMKGNFSRWYADEVKKALDQVVTLQDLKIDLRASLIKPLHTSWLMTAMSSLQDRSDVVL